MKNAVNYVNGAALVLALLVPAAATAGDYVSTSRSFTVKPGGNLHLESDVGRVEVKTHSRDEVIVTVRIDEYSHANNLMKFEFNQSGNSVYITGERQPRGWFSNAKRAPKVRYTILVPKEFDVDLNTSGGSISVADLNGTVQARTSGGGIDLGRIEGDIECATSGGGITVQEGGGQAELRTSGGSIQVARMHGPVFARTSGGPIKVGEAQDYVDLSTSGGSIEVTLSNQPVRDCRASTSGGGITVEVPERANFNLNASTSGGGVSCELALSDAIYTKSSLSGKVNQGGPEFHLRTSGGSIRIMKY